MRALLSPRARRALGLLFLALIVALSPVLPPAGAASSGELQRPEAVSEVAAGRSPALVLLSTTDVKTFDRVLSLARARGAAVGLAYPPDGFIAELTPQAEAALRGHPDVARVERGAVPVDQVGRLGRSAATAARAWNAVYMKVPDPSIPSVPPGAPPGGHDSPVRMSAPQAKRSASSLDATSAAPSAGQTSEFMAGSIVASVVFVESSGLGGNCGSGDLQTENWTDQQKANVISEISEGLSFWATRTGRPDPLTFMVEDLGATLGKTPWTSCEPISRPTSDDDLWVADALVSLGYSATPSNQLSVARSVASNRRNALGADWGYLIFVVDSEADSDGLFAGGGFAYAYLSGPYMVMTYDNDGWGIARTNYVTAHETGHIFGALDEYASSGCRTTDTWGYFSVANASCNKGGNTTDLSIMGEANEQQASGSDVSTSARGMIGWRNPGLGANGKTLVDVVRTSTVTLTPYSPDPTTDPTPTYSAVAGNTAYPPSTACNRIGNYCYRYPQPATVSKVVSAEWALDGGAYTSTGAAASDGAFDEESDAYTFTPASGVSDGSHTFRTRAINSFGHVSAVASDTLTVGSGGTTNNPPNKPGGPTPANGESGVAVTATLAWTGGDPDGDAVTYDVYFGTTSTPSTLACDGVSATSCDPSGDFAASTTYYWKVVSTDGHGATTTGDVWSFTTAAAPATGCPGGQYQATYFSNQALTPPSVLQACEAAPLNRTWGNGSPGAGIGVDRFSARWEGTFSFVGGNTTFYAKADDLVRVYVDGVKIIDRWKTATTSEVSKTVSLSAGNHVVKVEYVDKKGTAYVSVRWQ